MVTLETKNVVFDGCTFNPVRDLENSIWVSVNEVLQFIGFSKARIKNEVAKLESDIEFNSYVTRFNVEDVNSLFIKVGVLNKWMDNLSITKKTKREYPFLVERYYCVQLHAARKLMSAFTNEKLPELYYENQFSTLSTKMDRMFEDMGTLAQILINTSIQQQEKMQLQSSAGKKRKAEKVLIDINDYVDFEQWKYEVQTQAKQLVGESIWGSQKAVLSYVYDYLTKNYGIVWEQEINDCMENNKLVNRPNMLEVVYFNPTIRSIFDSVLKDVRAKYNSENYDVDEMIEPLIQKNYDNSNCGMATWRRVYARMKNTYNIDWEKETQDYKNKYKETPTTKKLLIQTSSNLRKYFEETVNDLLAEGVNAYAS